MEKRKNNFILKGGLIGGVIGLILSIIVNLVLSRDFYHFLNTLFTRFIISLILILIFALLGLFIGFLSSLVKSNIILKGALLGGIIGFVFSIFVMVFWEMFGWIIKPMSHINYLITGCEEWCIFMMFVYPIVFVILGILIFTMITFIILKMKNKPIWIGGIVGAIVGLIIIFPFIQFSHMLYDFDLFVIVVLSVLFYSLVGLLFGFIKRKYKLKWFIIGGIIGGFWGLASFFMGIATLERQVLEGFLCCLPFYIAYGIIGERALLLSPIIGVLIAVFMVFVIKKIKERINTKKKNEK